MQEALLNKIKDRSESYLNRRVTNNKLRQPTSSFMENLQLTLGTKICTSKSWASGTMQGFFSTGIDLVTLIILDGLHELQEVVRAVGVDHVVPEMETGLEVC